MPLVTASTNPIPSTTAYSPSSGAEVAVTPSTSADYVDVPSSDVDVHSTFVEHPLVTVDTPSTSVHSPTVENPISSPTEPVSVDTLRSESNNPEASEEGTRLETCTLHVESPNPENPPTIVQATSPQKDTKPTLFENPQEMESSENAAGLPETAEGRVDCPDSGYEDEKNIYRVKWIEFGLRNSAIITQNENGPCPLIRDNN